jgi:indoleamine 2,3-dioxygenase
LLVTKDILDHFSALLLAGQFRPRIKALPQIEITPLNITPLQRRAFVVLSFLAHGYLIGVVKHDTTVTILPKQIAIPWFKVAKLLDVKPVVSYAAVDLWNWYKLDDSLPVELDNLAMMHTFTGCFDEAWYYSLTKVLPNPARR